MMPFALRRLSFLPLLLPAALSAGAESESLAAPGALFPGPSPVLSGTEVLPAGQAFPLQVLVELPDTLVVMWEIREGYYLYRKSLDFVETGEGGVLGAPGMPAGVEITDEFFGDVEVYYDRLLVRIPFTTPAPEKMELTINYQGCAEVGYCYPPQQKMVTVEFP